MITYHMKLASQRSISLNAQTAADALQKALVLHPGETVASCYSGCRETHLVTTPNGTYRAGPAFIDYEIPPHVPYVPRQKSAPPETEPFAFLADIPRDFDKKETPL